MKPRIFGWFLLPFFGLAVHAATFTLTPNVVSNDYSGLITFKMTGLPAGETVLVQQFDDVNSNSVVDVGDICVRSELVTDGQARLLNGATNINLFRDEDGTTNGAIAASINFAAGPDIARGVASYLFRFSSPSNHFAPTNLTFTVNNQAYNQVVQGTVISGSTNVPSAYVALVENSGGNVQIVVTGTTADSNGNYLLRALPGVYQVMAFHAGYVGSLPNFPVVTLQTNATFTTNLNLIAATTTLAGSLVASINLLVKVLPNAQLIAFSTNFLVTFSEADSNSNFSIPVTTNNVWTVRATAQSAASEAYLVPDAGIENHYQTYTGPVTNAVITLKPATALINGRVADKSGNSITGVSLVANADFGQYNAFALSDSNGFYSMAIDAGAGEVDVINLASPPASNYFWPTPQFNINNGQAINISVTGLPVTAHLRCHVTDDNATPLPGVEAIADSYQFYGVYSMVTTDTNGDFDMPLFGGKWDFGIQTELTGLIFPNTPSFTIADGANLTNAIVARTVTGTISGYVHDSRGLGIANLSVAVTNQVGLTNFTLSGLTDSNGIYSVAVFNGAWNVSLNNDTLDNLGYTPADPVTVNVPPANGVANFMVAIVPPPQILTTNLFDATINNYYGADLLATNGSGNIFWSLTSGALPGGLVLDASGYIYGAPTNLGLFTFTLKAQDSRGSNEVRALSLQVDLVLTGPPQILTTYLADSAQGCPYATQLQATNGTPPYSWALASGSAALPPDLNLEANGRIDGTPEAAGYYTIQVQLTGADNETTNSTVEIQVNSALQILPYPLSAGEVGAAYSSSLYASGGAQPQTWSVVAGALPPGLALDPATGYITGTPSTPATNDFTLRVTDGCAVIDTPAAITNYPMLQISTTSLPAASLNEPYNGQLQAAGGVPPYSWYAYPALPYGLTLDTDGAITGTPVSESAGELTFVVYDSLGNGVMTNLILGAVTQPVLDLPTMAAGNLFTFRVTGVAGQGYTLQTSLDFSNWSDLYTTNAPADVFFWSDTNTFDSQRYYRLESSP